MMSAISVNIGNISFDVSSIDFEIDVRNRTIESPDSFSRTHKAGKLKKEKVCSLLVNRKGKRFSITQVWRQHASWRSGDRYGQPRSLRPPHS